MSTTTNLSTLKINYLTQAQYDAEAAGGRINENELYFTPDSGGGIGTSIPTADTTAMFDSSAHMNSSDMSSQDVSDFVDSLDTQGASLDEALNTFDSAQAGTLALYNCTGTISHNNLFFYKSKGGEIWVQGRVNINSFVRTGANCGVNITLPSNVPTPSLSLDYQIGFRAQEPREFAAIRIVNGSRTAQLFTSESFTNAQNGTLTFICSGRIFVK